jgi:hypothetical chaperone protein
MRAVGIDFGTTNSAVAVVEEDGSVRSLSWPSAAGDVGVFRTALAFWSEGRAPRAVVRTAGGPQALEHALSGTGSGRFVQSIKTYLGSRAFTETRLFGRRFSIEELVSTFLGHLLPERDALLEGTAGIVAGRPVVFAGDNPDEALAVGRLGTAFAQAGFGAVDLAYEPLGAAYWYARDLAEDQTVLVADFGGGTSDFSVIRFRRAGGRQDAEALAHGGVGLAGDTFDYRLIDRYVAPQLGKGSHYRSFDKLLPIPAYVHAAFSQWHQLSWLKAPATMAELRKLQAASDDPDAMERLIDFVDLDLGFELYQAISAVKIRLSEAESTRLDFDSHGIRLSADVTRAEFERLIAPDLARMAAAADDTLRRAGLGHGDIDAVFTTGGTSQVPAVRRLFVERFGEDRLHAAHPLQSVASGLALYAADRASGRAGSGL